MNNLCDACPLFMLEGAKFVWSQQDFVVLYGYALKEELIGKSFKFKGYE